MNVSLATKFALRSLGRRRRRTFLSVIGVGVGCAVAVFLSSFMRGSDDLRVRGVAESGVGHLRIAPAGWPQTFDSKLRLRDWQAELAAVRSLGAVKTAVPRARAEALLAFGTRVVGVEMVGVDPDAEFALNRLARAIAEGRYLQADEMGATVVGRSIADRLDVELEDDLFVTVVREGGEMEYAMLRIVGIVETGSRDMDLSICHVTLENLHALTGQDGAGEITVLLHDADRIKRVVATLNEQIREGNVVVPWQVVVPAIGGDQKSDRAFMALFGVIVVAVVVLGIASAQLTAILERKREFTVLMALGMKGRQLMRLVLTEAAIVGLLGAAVGLLIATPLVYMMATRGLDFAAILGEQMSVSGVLYDPVMYGDMGWWMIPRAFLVALSATLIAAVYPAWSATRTNPASALSLREA